MRKESSLLLWALLPVIAALKEAGLLRKRVLVITRSAETVLRLSVWALLVRSIVLGRWHLAFGIGIGLAALACSRLIARWLITRMGWRKRWLQS